jgi:crotonobetainyl-CoA:carnitine CoA-transferase CaiB-like acyl-CoA transferase
MRHIGPFYHDVPDPEKSLYWFTFNTSKRSITLDITKTDGQEIFKNLVKTADFVIECFPPGYLDSLGLGYSILSEINPRLVMTSITPFGQSGPYCNYKACDIVGVAMGGLMYLIGEQERPPVRVTAQQGYAQASAQAAAGIMVAHYHRVISGEGQYVDVSMQEAVSNTLDTTQQAWDLQQMIYHRVGHSRPVGDRILRCVYPCKDGYMACWGPEDFGVMVEWMESCGVPVNHAEIQNWLEVWQKVQEGEVPLSQAITQEELTEMQAVRAPLLASYTKKELYDEAVQKGFGWAPVSTPGDLLNNQQLEVRDYFVRVEHPELDASIIYPGAPYKLSETPWRIKNRAPLIGEHNEEIYAGELGMSGEKIAALRQARII